jgi:hypothetical protein
MNKCPTGVKIEEMLIKAQVLNFFHTTPNDLSSFNHAQFRKFAYYFRRKQKQFENLVSVQLQTATAEVASKSRSLDERRHLIDATKMSSHVHSNQDVTSTKEKCIKTKFVLRKELKESLCLTSLF